MKKNYKMKLAGHTFALAKVRFGIHSEETCDFIADLICDNITIGRVSNEGHGGATDFYAYSDRVAEATAALDDVRKEIWLTCADGTVLYHDLGTVADEVLYKMYV